MEENKKLSVSEYAAAAGISKQAVYKQLNNRLKNFLIEVDGRKYLSSKALELLQPQRLNNVEQPIKQQFNNQSQPLWERELEEKNKIIESLMRQVDKLQEQNGQLTELLKNSQVLLAAEKKQLLIEQETTTQSSDKKGFFKLFKTKK